MTGLPPSGLKTWLPGSIRNTTGREMRWETNWRCTRNCGRIIRRKCAYWRADCRWRWMITEGILTGNMTNRYIVLLFCRCLLVCFVSLFVCFRTWGGCYIPVLNLFCRVGFANMICFLVLMCGTTVHRWNLLCSTVIWYCWNPIVLPFIWKPLSCTFMWHCLLHIPRQSFQVCK